MGVSERRSCEVGPGACFVAVAGTNRDGHEFLPEAAARELGIHKATLFKKIRKLGIELPDVDGRSRHSRRKP